MEEQYKNDIFKKIDINKEDIIERIYFITKLVQNQTKPTMQGALTSKSDSMGGIFDRFINTISDSLVFEKIILSYIKNFFKIKKDIHVVNDYYFYDPKKVGIASDIFGITVDNKTIAFTHFNDGKWNNIDNMPQIEIKTYKAKDQMITLRDQDYKGYLIFVDLDLRVDYLVPFLDSKLLNKDVMKKMTMDNKAFNIEKENQNVKEIAEIDFSTNKIGTLQILSITNVEDFKKYATLCGANISVRRMKSIIERKRMIRKGILHEKLSEYANENKDIKGLFSFNHKWNEKKHIKSNEKMLDFSAEKIEKIEICQHKQNGIVITALEDGCSFYSERLEVGKQYTVDFDVLGRDGNNGEEYFMQKKCVKLIAGKENELVNKLINIIEKGE